MHVNRTVGFQSSVMLSPTYSSCEKEDGLFFLGVHDSAGTQLIVLATVDSGNENEYSFNEFRMQRRRHKCTREVLGCGQNCVARMRSTGASNECQAAMGRGAIATSTECSSHFHCNRDASCELEAKIAPRASESTPIKTERNASLEHLFKFSLHLRCKSPLPFDPFNTN